MGLLWVFCYFCGSLDSQVPDWGSVGHLCLASEPHKGSLVHWGLFHVGLFCLVSPLVCAALCQWGYRIRECGQNFASTLELDLYYSLANNFSVFYGTRRIFFIPNVILDPWSWVEKVHKFLQEENISGLLLLQTKHTKTLKLSASVSLEMEPVLPCWAIGNSEALMKSGCWVAAIFSTCNYHFSHTLHWKWKFVSTPASQRGCCKMSITTDGPDACFVCTSH